MIKAHDVVLGVSIFQNNYNPGQKTFVISFQIKDATAIFIPLHSYIREYYDLSYPTHTRTVFDSDDL